LGNLAGTEWERRRQRGSDNFTICLLFAHIIKYPGFKAHALKNFAVNYQLNETAQQVELDAKLAIDLTFGQLCQ
jgi:hypothetical protein